MYSILECIEYNLSAQKLIPRSSFQLLIVGGTDASEKEFPHMVGIRKIIEKYKVPTYVNRYSITFEIKEYVFKIYIWIFCHFLMLK